eukprot:jgi/Tetstr1/463853/TSEL_008667.t1
MGRREKRYQPRSANDLAGRANLASALRAERQLLAGGSSGGSQVERVKPGRKRRKRRGGGGHLADAVVYVSSSDRAGGGSGETDSDSDEGALHIGSVRVRRQQSSKLFSRASGRRRTTSECSEEGDGGGMGSGSGSDGSLGEILQDYMDNLANAENEEVDSEIHDSEDADDSRYIRGVLGMFAALGRDGEGSSKMRDPGEGRPPEDIGACSEGSAGEAEERTLTALETKYPVQVRRARNSDEDVMADSIELHERRRRRLLPGEKNKLRKERIMAKRAARAASKGFDICRVNMELQSFITSGRDMHAFPSMGKMELHLVQRLASLYGLRSSVQGSGKKRFVMIRSSQSMAIPKGMVLRELQELIHQHSKLERVGESFQMMSAHNDPSSMLPALGANAPSNRGRRKPSKSKRMYSSPVNFVSTSVIHGTQSPTEQSKHGPAFSVTCVPAQRGPAAGCGTVELGYQAEQSDGDVSLGSERETMGLGYSESDDMEEEAAEGAMDSVEVAQRGVTVNKPADAIPVAFQLAMMEVEEAMPADTTLEDAASSDADEAAPDLSPSQTVRAAVMDTGQRDAPHPASPRPSVGGGDARVKAGAWHRGKAATKAEEKKARKKAEKEQRRAQRRAPQEGGNVQAAQRGGVGGQAAPGHRVAIQYGGFERHTTGFGSRMLAKMGFAGAGTGLGRNGQGIAEPIKAAIRPRQMGLGHDSRGASSARRSRPNQPPLMGAI